MWNFKGHLWNFTQKSLNPYTAKRVFYCLHFCGWVMISLNCDVINLNETGSCSVLLNDNGDCYKIWPNYRKISNIKRKKFQKSNISRLRLQLSLCNKLKPGVEWRMQAMLQLQVSDTQFNRLLKRTYIRDLTVLTQNDDSPGKYTWVPCG